VDLTWRPHCLEIVVTDNGRDPGRPASSSSGFGLVGMRERAALYGGTATAGPGQAGGWGVKATIPIIQRGAL
jgi:signal transduction histidine kinase